MSRPVDSRDVRGFWYPDGNVGRPFSQFQPNEVSTRDLGPLRDPRGNPLSCGRRHQRVKGRTRDVLLSLDRYPGFPGTRTSCQPHSYVGKTEGDGLTHTLLDWLSGGVSSRTTGKVARVSRRVETRTGEDPSTPPLSSTSSRPV